MGSQASKGDVAAEGNAAAADAAAVKTNGQVITPSQVPFTLFKRKGVSGDWWKFNFLFWNIGLNWIQSTLNRWNLTVRRFWAGQVGLVASLPPADEAAHWARPPPPPKKKKKLLKRASLLLLFFLVNELSSSLKASVCLFETEVSPKIRTTCLTAAGSKGEGGCWSARRHSVYYSSLVKPEPDCRLSLTLQIKHCMGWVTLGLTLGTLVHQWIIMNVNWYNMLITHTSSDRKYTSLSYILRNWIFLGCLFEWKPSIASVFILPSMGSSLVFVEPTSVWYLRRSVRRHRRLSPD